MNRRILCQSIAAMGFAVVGADRARASDQPSTICGQLISLRLNETFTTEAGVTIRLSGLKDHRCPTDVECFWEGYAEIWLDLAGPNWGQLGYPATEYLTVGLEDMGLRRYGSLVLLLASLSPTPRPALDTLLGDYELGLVLLETPSPSQTA